jgi:hypothetical protein
VLRPFTTPAGTWCAPTKNVDVFILGQTYNSDRKLSCLSREIISSSRYCLFFCVENVFEKNLIFLFFSLLQINIILVILDKMIAITIIMIF